MNETLDQKQTNLKLDKNGGGSWVAPEMPDDTTQFFPFIVDNFFDDPDLIRDYGLSLPKGPSPDSKWPGIRTAPLHEIDQQLAQQILLKVFSAYFDLGRQNVQWGFSNIYFHEIPPYNDNPEDILNQGWVHQDSDVHFAGLVYLNPNPRLDSGTSLFRMKTSEEANFLKYGRRFGFYPWRYFKDGTFYRGKDCANYMATQGAYTDEAYQATKQYTSQWHKEKKGDGKPREGIGVYGKRIDAAEVSDDEYREEFKKFHDRYEETVNIKNVYNRFVGYDAQNHHRLNNYVMKDTKESRFTMTLFVRDVEIERNRVPIVRIKDRENSDLFIEKHMTTHRKDLHKLRPEFRKGKTIGND